MGNAPTKQTPDVVQQPSQCPAVPNTATEASSCPVPEKYRNPAVYNVYNQRINDPNATQVSDPLAAIRGTDLIDPKNNMPLEANQQPCPGQRKPLPTERMQSTIPKGGTESTWLYPSPQMFFNALRRKGKGEDVTEEHMEAVVHAHNTMNELTWREVMFWEKLHSNECSYPTLLRFMGRPDALSPKARVMSWLGKELPFDRHDWIIDRCGQEVRYIIDFYYNDDKAGTPQAFDLDVRPALDSFESAVDRVKMTIYEQFAAWGLPCPITGHAGSIVQQGEQQQGSSSASSSAQTTAG